MSSSYRIASGGFLRGTLRVPGDKSISHRAAIFGAIAEGTTEVSGFLQGEDCHATLNAFRAMGVRVDNQTDDRILVHGVGLHGLKAPERLLDLGNSGTSMRLMAGLLAGQTFASQLTGDESLCRRPMNRIIDPLRLMGAVIEGDPKGKPPLRIAPSKSLKGIGYALPVASAQVKSCLLLAGLYAEGITRIHESEPSRDHTELMLKSFGYPLKSEPGSIAIQGGHSLKATAIDVPADLSSAAFFMVGASIAKGSDITLEAVGINPTRAGVIDVLIAMGADIELLNRRNLGAEPVADIRVRSAALKGMDIPRELVPLAIDEFPAIFIAAACAEGETRLSGAAELRVKESDRIAVMAEGLNACGISAIPTADGIAIQGGPLRAARIASHGDHRVAMSFAMAALCADGEMRIDDCANVNTSFPGFAELAKQAGLKLVLNRND